MTSNRAAVYAQPTAVDVLVISSYLYLLNLVREVFDGLFNSGLVGEVGLGIIYGTPLAGILSSEWEQTFWDVGYIGLILIVFEGGLFTNLDTLRNNLLLSCLVAITGVAVPIALSILLLSVAFGFPVLEGFAGGAALAATSLGTTLSLLSSDFNNNSKPSHDLRQSRIGSVLLSAALIDDIIGLILASVIPPLRSANGTNRRELVEAVLRPIGVSIGLFLLLELRPIRDLVTGFLQLIARRLQPTPHQRAGLLFLMVASISAGVAATYYGGASMLFGAWLAGAFLGETDRSMQTRNSELDTLAHDTPSPPLALEDAQETHPSFGSVFHQHVAPIQNTLLAPLFFGSIGTAIPFIGLWEGRILWRGLLYALLMTIAKLVVGLWVVFWPSPPGSTHPRPVYPALLLAIAMVARGEISLLIAQIGHLSDDAYKVVMWAVLLCTLIGPLGTGVLLKRRRERCAEGHWS